MTLACSVARVVIARLMLSSCGIGQTSSGSKFLHLSKFAKLNSSLAVDLDK
jgi:hypothetical protein